ncbi:hypothetical protein [Metabacillus bambusae]|uniref:Phage portal protein n=1 Tax=Metabacillus bambusae TaxID=2795218 RepID=A0ABS3N569_9BACI|nr:hypothetical protein [Metabacillus bambusae]MBO1513441.1 hypothetical protein [Metabacillus bambusae]
MVQQENKVIIQFNSGTWQFTYVPTTSYVKEFTRHTKLKELLDIPPIREIVLNEIPDIRAIPPYLLNQYEQITLEEIMYAVDSKLATDLLDKVEELFKAVTN